MDSSLELWLVEFRRKLDEFDARMDRRWAALEQRGAAAEPHIVGGIEQSGATQFVVADNWGGLFDLAPVPAERVLSSDIKQSGAMELVVPDNWGGLFDKVPAADSDAVPVTATASGASSAVVPDNWGGWVEQSGNLSADVVFTDLTSTGQIHIDIGLSGTDSEFTSSAVLEEIESEENLLQIQEREEVLEVGEIVLPSSGTEVLKVVVAALDNNSLAWGTQSAPRPPRRAPRRSSRLRHPRRAPLLPPSLLRQGRAPPRPPQLRQLQRAPPCPPRLHLLRRAPPRRRGRPPRFLARGRLPQLQARARPRARRLQGVPRGRIRRRRRRLRPRLLAYANAVHAEAQRPCVEDVGADDSVDPGPNFPIHGATEDTVLFLSGSALLSFEQGVHAAEFLPKLPVGPHPPYTVVCRNLPVRDDVQLSASEALAEQATKEHFTKAFELVFASHLLTSKPTTVRPAALLLLTDASATSNAEDEGTLHTRCLILDFFHTACVLVSRTSASVSVEMPRGGMETLVPLVLIYLQSEQLIVNWRFCVFSKLLWTVSELPKCSRIIDRQAQIEEHVSDTSLEDSLGYSSENTFDALCAATLIIDNNTSKGLIKFLQTHCEGETLAVAGSKLRNAMNEKMEIKCLLVGAGMAGSYAMRVREWNGWQCHFQYAKVVLILGNRTNVVNLCFSEILSNEELETQLKEVAVISMETEVSDLDWLNIRELCDQVLALSEYRFQLYEYLGSTMITIAPNLTALLGEFVGARLLAHGESLLNLAKAIDNHLVYRVIFLETVSADMNDTVLLNIFSRMISFSIVLQQLKSRAQVTVPIKSRAHVTLAALIVVSDYVLLLPVAIPQPGCKFSVEMATYPLCFHLKPPWKVPALAEFLDDGIFWILFLDIAPVYGYWNLQWFLVTLGFNLLALKNQHNKQLQQGGMVFVGSSVIVEKIVLEVIGKNLKNNATLTVVFLGEFDGEWPEKLEAIIVAAASGASGFEFGVDSNVDPELALTLISMADERARQEAAAKQAREELSKSESAGFPAVVWLLNWLCFHLLWKPPWQQDTDIECVDTARTMLCWLLVKLVVTNTICKARMVSMRLSWVKSANQHQPWPPPDALSARMPGVGFLSEAHEEMAMALHPVRAQEVHQLSIKNMITAAA